MPTRVTVVTANIGRGVGAGEAAANIRRVIRGYRKTPWRRSPAVIGWQEIDDADAPQESEIMHRALRQLTPGTETAGYRSAVPITAPTEWRIVHHRIDKTCDGIPKASPNRYCVQALLEHRATGLRYAHLNGHYPLPRLTGWPLWEQCDRAWRDIVDGWLDRGYTVITTRDRNKAGGGDPLAPFERDLLPGHLIDRITVIQTRGDTGAHVEAGDDRTVQLTIDGHDAHGVPLTLEPWPPRHRATP